MHSVMIVMFETLCSSAFSFLCHDMQRKKRRFYLVLSECEDEEKRRELQERLKECDEVSINVIMYRPVDHYLQLYQLPCTEVDTNEAKP